MHETHWTAQWIGAPDGLQKKALVNLTNADAEVINSHDGLKPVLYFRKHFLLIPDDIVEAKLFVTARGLYKVFVNSNKFDVQSSQGLPELSPGWTDYNKTIQYQVYDVTTFIVGEGNTIGAMVGTGWHSGYVGFSRGHGYYGSNEFLLLELHMNYKNGSKIVVSTDNTWKVTTGPLIYSDLLQGELFYENRNLMNWVHGDYDDSQWSLVVTEPLNKAVKLVADASPEVTWVGAVVPVTSWKLSEDKWIYDFGINFAGYVMIAINSDIPANVTIQVRHAEVLNTNGTIYTKNLRLARAIDTYVLNGNFKCFK